MTKLTSTYNFAKISEYVYVPEWHDKVSMDHPFSDGEDGIIEVRMRNVSPLFTRDGQPSSRDKKDVSPYSAHIMEKDGRRRYYLPATSVKGMLRMTMEAMTYGRMSQFTDRSFGYRDFGGKQTQTEYMAKVADVHCGWLEKEGDQFILTPCDGNFETISIQEVRKTYKDFDKEKSAWKRNMKTGFYPLINHDDCEYFLVATGKIDSKKVEYLFPKNTLEPFTVPEDVAQAFVTIHEQTPDFEKFLVRLENDRIAVFYIPDKARGVKAIGMAKMLKYPYEKSLGQILSTQQKKTEGHDLAEVIFGYIDRNGHESLKGRVHIGNAFAEEPIADSRLYDLQSGVLGQPKPSFYPLYLRQAGNPYKTYDNPDGIAGRKLYRIHQGITVTNLPQGNNNENLIAKFKPIPEGQVFTLRIAVHNLRPVETGALISALILHDTKGCYHNLGLAKGFGYGKLEVLSVKLQHLTQDADAYMRAFEKELSIFCMDHENKLWCNSEEPLSLLQILTEHDDKDLVMMQLKDFREVSKNSNFDTLRERKVSINSKLTQEDLAQIEQNYNLLRQKKEEEERQRAFALTIERCRNEYKEQLQEAASLLQNGQLDMAQRQFSDIEQKTLRIFSISLPEVTAALDKINTRKNELEQSIKEQERKKQEEKMNKGFDSFINEKNLHGELKVRDFKLCEQKTNKWLRDAGRDMLTADERKTYAMVIARLKQNHSKKEDKLWNDKNSSLWKKVRQVLGDEWQGEPL